MIVTGDERSAGSATACLPCRIFVVINVAPRDLGSRAPDLPFFASVACAAPSVDSHQDLPKGGHEVGRVAITDNDRGSLAVAPPVSSLPSMLGIFPAPDNGSEAHHYRPCRRSHPMHLPSSSKFTPDCSECRVRNLASHQMGRNNDGRSRACARGLFVWLLMSGGLAWRVLASLAVVACIAIWVAEKLA